MQLFRLHNNSSMGSDATTMQHQQADNPYSRDSRHVKETIELATSIVRACSNGQLNDHLSSSSSASLLERMCVLLTPNDSDDGVVVRKNNPPPVPIVGASYDSSMAGIAANSLLLQFIGGDSQNNGGQSTNNLAFLLANALAHILDSNATTSNSTHANDDDTHHRRSVQIKAAIVLNQLAATEPSSAPIDIVSPFDQEQFSPYGHPPPPNNMATTGTIPTSWCHVLVHSQALSTLVQQLPTTQAVSFNNELELCEKCVWAIGNLAGDSIMAKDALLKMGALPRLIKCVSLGFSLVRQQQQQQQQPNSVSNNSQQQQSLIDLMRNSVWALNNLFREGGMPASEFLDMQNPQMSLLDGEQGQMNTPQQRLTARDVSMLLSATDVLPSPSTTINATNGIMMNDETSKTTWMDVAIDTCWLVSYLTTNDSMAVDYLCGDEKRKESCVGITSMLVSRLVQATDAASRQLNIAASNANAAAAMQYDIMGCLIPCCRSLKNIAIACDGRYVNSILLAEIKNPGVTNESIRRAESFLAKLISLGTLGAGREVSTIASEAAAVAGACLYDAGLPLPNPATSACRSLLPAFCQALVCPLSTFEFRREVIWALWTAVNFPPELQLATQQDANKNVEVVQNELLGEIIRTSPDAMARALTTMLSTLDSGVLEATLSLINLLLRRLDNSGGIISNCDEFGGKKKISILFEEAGLVDTLWRICDHDSEESETAELAAEILDDFYEEGDEDEADESMLQPASLGGQFQFQAPSSQGIPEAGFNFGASAEQRW